MCVCIDVGAFLALLGEMGYKVLSTDLIALCFMFFPPKTVDPHVAFILFLVEGRLIEGSVKKTNGE